jgi:hypothetical protein
MEEESVPAEEELAAEINEAQALWEAGAWREARARLLRLRETRGDQPMLLAALGDCHAAGQRWREAVRWYDEALAAQYDPQLAARAQEARRHLVRGPISPTARAAVYAAAGLLLLAVIILLVTLHTWRSATPAPRLAPEAAGRPMSAISVPQEFGGSPSQRPPSPPPPATSQRPQTAPITGSEEARVSSTPYTQTPSGPPVKVTAVVEAPKTNEDRFLTQLLETLTWPDGTPLTGDAIVQFVPSTGYALATVSIPRSLSTPDLRQTVLDQAYAVAVALIKGSTSVRFVTVRALYTIALPDRKNRTVVAFSGNTSREALEYWDRLNRRPNHQELWYQVFAACYWNPEVPVTPERQPQME